MSLTEDTAKGYARNVYNSIIAAESQTEALAILKRNIDSTIVRNEAKSHLRDLINGDDRLRPLLSDQALSHQGGRRKSNRRRSKRSRRSRRNKRR